MKQDKDLTLISQAAANASEAAHRAAEAAATAAENATIAAKSASDSAIVINGVATDTSWVKKSLERVELTLNEMQKAYVTAVQHQDVLKRLDTLETKVTALEFWRAALVASWGVAVVIITFLYFQLAQPFIIEVLHHIQGK